MASKINEKKIVKTSTTKKDSKELEIENKKLNKTIEELISDISTLCYYVGSIRTRNEINDMLDKCKINKDNEIVMVEDYDSDDDSDEDND